MKSILKLTAVIAVLAAVAWLGVKLLPLFAPFVLSLTAAAVTEPAVRALERRGVRRSLASGILSCIVLCLCAGLVGGCVMGGAQLVTSYVKQTPRLLVTLSETADTLRQHVFVLLRNVPDPVEQELRNAAESVSLRLSEVPVWLSEKALSGVTAFAKHSPDWVLFLCTAVIGVYFFSVYYREICGFFRRQMSEETLRKLALIRAVTLGAATGYLKVQCIISGVTFLILLAAFQLMGIEGKLTAAAGIAVIDALPILGSGAVLIPWALIALLTGKVTRAAAVGMVYGVLLVTHNLLQAKLMGSHLGLHPVTALVSMYVGWKLGGLLGMLLLPVACVLLCSLNDAGIIRLYQ